MLKESKVEIVDEVTSANDAEQERNDKSAVCQNADGKDSRQKKIKKEEHRSNVAILFDHVTKVYTSSSSDDEHALYDVSASIDQGEFVFLVGHSGSGKSTFIRSIIREVVPDEGRIEVGGYDVVNMRPSRVPYLRRNIGCVFQDFKLLPNKTAYENVAFAMECVGKSRSEIKKRVPIVLSLVGLGDKTDKLPDELSGGEQQRVAIARAIVNQPPLLICDEPTGNLDPHTSEGIMNLLVRINEGTGSTVLIATHDQETVDKMHKRVIRLSDGVLISDEEDGAYDA